jgi:putative addiction module component (TIGR02574 family)
LPAKQAVSAPNGTRGSTRRSRRIAWLPAWPTSVAERGNRLIARNRIGFQARDAECQQEVWKDDRMSKAAFDIEQLSPGERLDLIENLWDSLSDDDVPLTDAQRQELDHRLDALDREGQVGVPWEQVSKSSGTRKRYHTT